MHDRMTSVQDYRLGGFGGFGKLGCDYDARADNARSMLSGLGGLNGETFSTIADGIDTIFGTFTGSTTQKTSQRNANDLALIQAQARVAEANASAMSLQAVVPYIAGSVAIIGLSLIAWKVLK